MQSPRLSAESKALLHYINQQREPVDFYTLQAACNTDTALRKRLGNLCSTGWLQKNVSGGVTTWRLLRSIRSLGAAPTPTPQQSTPAPKGDFPERRCIDVMTTRYEPKPFAPARLGAMDYIAINSRGLRC